jgi:hypothetical protein
MPGKKERYSGMNTEFDELKQVHNALICKYVEAINQVSRLPFFVPRENGRGKTPRKLKKSLTLGYPVKLFVASHIKGKLSELSKAYFYKAQTVPDEIPAAGDFRSWLKETSDTCERMAGTLSSWQSFRGVLSGVWPVGIGLLTAWLGVSNPYELIINFFKLPLGSGNFLRIVALILVIIVTISFAGSFILAPFTYKREMFMPGLNADEQPLQPGQPKTSAPNVYQLEDWIFNRVNTGKKREFPYDQLFLILIVLYFALFTPFYWLFLFHKTAPWYIWLTGVSTALPIFIVMVRGPRRKYR